MATHEVEIDLKAEKSEAEWLATSDRFWLTATPKLFEWLGWVAVLAGLNVVQRAEPSFAVGAVVGLCYVAVLFYFLAFFARFNVVGIPGLASPTPRLLGSIILSTLVAFGSYLLARHIAAILSTVL